MKLRWVAPILLGSITVMAIVSAMRKPSAPGYPRVGMYSAMRTTGSPFVIEGRVDTAACRAQARYDWIIIDPARKGQPLAALQLIRSMNPRATILAHIRGEGLYVCGDGWYGQEPPPSGCDTTTIAWSVYRAVRGEAGLLFDRSGGPLMTSEGIGIDYARPGVAAALADTFAAWVAASGSNGGFTDGPCSSIAGWWPGSQTDYERSGYPSLAAWDSAYTAGTLELFQGLHRRMAGRPVCGNCGPRGPLSTNGWTGENWPFQNPGSWQAWDSLLTWADTAYAAPELSWITSMREGLEFRGAECQRRFRFGLASATLHDHVVHALVGTSFDPLRGFAPDQWGDEFSVNPKGFATGDASYKGWLGRPLSAARWQGPVRRRDFEHGVVLVNPTTRSVKLMMDTHLYRISGTQDPEVNNGDAVPVVTIPPSDGLFLVRR